MPGPSYWLLGSAILFSAQLASPLIAVAQPAHNNLSETAEQFFRQAIEAQPPSSERPNPKEANVAALEKLKSAPWPDVQRLKRVRITSRAEVPVERTAWQVAEDESSVTLLYDDFAIRPLTRKHILQMVASDYLLEIRAILSRHEALDKNEYVIPISLMREGYLDGYSSRPPLLGNAILALHAYCAAERGHTLEAKKLLEATLVRHPSAFDTLFREWSWSSFQRGIELLESGAPWKEVASQWQETLKRFGASEYAKQLEDYQPQLEKQAAADDELSKLAVVEPDKLPVAERIAYYVARFPDVHGVQFSQPGHCITHGMGEGTKFSDAVIAIGFPAIPSLIDSLEDRRLTRSIGFWRDFSPSRIVLRAQDVAVRAIERIVSERFYEVRSTSSYFSTETSATRAEVIVAIKAWWKENGAKSPIDMHLSRLDDGRAYERLARLKKILQLDTQALDEMTTLKRWAGQSYSEDMCEYAEELARLGDLSLLPAIRGRALDTIRLPASEAIWFLTRHGNAQDFRILRETMLKERRKGADSFGGNSLFGPISGSCCESTNPLAAPLLVDLLQERKRDDSLAERSLVALIGLTGHDANYRSESSHEEREVAMDRWLMWWKDEGQEAYFAKYPSARDVIAERGIEFDEIGIRKLPSLVPVADRNDDLPITFDVPRQLLSGLLKAKQVSAHEDARGLPTFRFASPTAGLAWFDTMKPVPSDDPAAAPLVPAMRVKTRGLTRPDSRGRVWCTWDQALSPIAVFDGATWNSRREQLPPGRVDNPIGFISVFQAADGAMVFLDRNHRFHLFDTAGHVRVNSSSELFSQHAERLARALPQPLLGSDGYYFHLVKDSRGRVWWSNWETDWGVVDGNKIIIAGGEIPSVEVKRGYRHDLIFPAADGRVFVFPDDVQGRRGVLAELAGEKIVRLSDIPISVDSMQNSQLAVRDRQGRVWITTQDGSRALDGAGKLVADHRGRILLEDRAGCLWFHVGDRADNTALVRLSMDGKEFKIDLPSLRRNWPVAESPDGTFWAVSGKELVQIRPEGKQLLEVARYAAPQSNYIWCDNDGRVWLTGGRQDEQAVRLAVAKRLEHR